MTSPNIVVGSTKHISKAAASRELSPIPSPPNMTAKVQPPRTPPAIRPSSTLSPRYEASSRYEPMRSPSPLHTTSRTDINQRRGNPNSLNLPSLPRFHPSNFTSSQSSLSSSPDASSPYPPPSPRTHQRTISDAQKRLLAYQREMISTRSTTPVQLENPAGPRLLPLGSPGPVTPLQLEVEEASYLLAGTRISSDRTVSAQELVEKLVKEETARQVKKSSRQSKR